MQQTLKLKKEIEIDGKKTTEIKYDLEALDGTDIQHAINELAKRSLLVTMAETDMNYHAMLFSIASGVSYEDILHLGIKDFNNISRTVRDFFLED